MQEIYDLAVIGSGPGGYVAAIRAAQLGLRVCIIESSQLGGICLNWGCIPTKALLKAGELYERVSDLGSLGVTAGEVSIDFERMIQRSRETAKKLSAGVAFLMKKNRIEVIEGHARLEVGMVAPGISVTLKSGETLSVIAEAVILASGARPRTNAALGLVPDGDCIWTYREALSPSWLPESLLVFGSDAIAIEFASFYAALGAQVTVVEASDRILPGEDGEVAAAAQKAFEKRGIRFLLETAVTRLEKTENGVSATVATAGEVDNLLAEAAIVAMGVTGNVEDLGLEALGLDVEQGRVVTDENGATSFPSLYAIGDVAGGPTLAHKAMHEGVRCVEFIAGRVAPEVRSPIPVCTYSQPQIASVGLTEAQAVAAGLPIKVGRYAFRNNGKAIVSGDTDGFIKTLFHTETGELIGAHLIGAEVTEMVQGFVIAMTLNATQEQLRAMVFPHPTMSEVMYESALAAFGMALHM